MAFSKDVEEPLSTSVRKKMKERKKQKRRLLL
jgi:hypothetical protein